MTENAAAFVWTSSSGKRFYFTTHGQKQLIAVAKETLVENIPGLALEQIEAIDTSKPPNIGDIFAMTFPPGPASNSVVITEITGLSNPDGISAIREWAKVQYTQIAKFALPKPAAKQQH